MPLRLREETLRRTPVPRRGMRVNQMSIQQHLIQSQRPVDSSSQKAWIDCWGHGWQHTKGSSRRCCGKRWRAGGAKSRCWRRGSRGRAKGCG